MTNIAEQRTIELKKMQDFLEQERDKLYDQAANLQGQKDRLDWTIRAVMARIEQIHKEEEQRAILMKQQEEMMAPAKKEGNVGEHPSVRKENLAKRKAESKSKQKSSSKK